MTNISLRVTYGLRFCFQFVDVRWTSQCLRDDCSALYKAEGWASSPCLSGRGSATIWVPCFQAERSSQRVEVTSGLSMFIHLGCENMWKHSETFVRNFQQCSPQCARVSCGLWFLYTCVRSHCLALCDSCSCHHRKDSRHKLVLSSCSQICQRWIFTWRYWAKWYLLDAAFFFLQHQASQ